MAVRRKSAHVTKNLTSVLVRRHTAGQSVPLVDYVERFAASKENENQHFEFRFVLP
jgi:hypothetical protein